MEHQVQGRALLWRVLGAAIGLFVVALGTREQLAALHALASGSAGAAAASG